MPQCWLVTSQPDLTRYCMALVTLHYNWVPPQTHQFSRHSPSRASNCLLCKKLFSHFVFLCTFPSLSWASARSPHFEPPSSFLWMSASFDQGSALLVAFIIYFTEHKKGNITVMNQKWHQSSCLPVAMLTYSARLSRLEVHRTPRGKKGQQIVPPHQVDTREKALQQRHHVYLGNVARTCMPITRHHKSRMNENRN